MPEIEEICAESLEMGAAWWPLFLRKVVAWPPKWVRVVALVLGSVVEKNGTKKQTKTGPRHKLSPQDKPSEGLSPAVRVPKQLCCPMRCSNASATV